MKTQQDENNCWPTLRKRFRRRRERCDPILVLNMSSFDFTDEWRRMFFEHDYARSNA